MNTCVLIYSCDKYSDVWGPFFKLFFKYWDCPYPVYLVTESEQCLLPNVKTINANGEWTERVQKAVREIPTKYVIGMCEDFFFRRDVRQDLIERCVMYMEHDHEIGCFNFEKERQPGIKIEISLHYPNFGKKQNAGHYFQKSCQPTLWRRKYLEELLDCKLDPWHWEWQEREYDLNHFIWIGSEEETAFSYGLHDRNNFGIVQGKWAKDDVEPLFKKEHIDIDLSIRGCI